MIHLKRVTIGPTYNEFGKLQSIHLVQLHGPVRYNKQDFRSRLRVWLLQVIQLVLLTMSSFGYYEQLCTTYNEFSYEQFSVSHLQRVCLLQAMTGSCLNELGFCEQYSESCLQHVCLLQAMTGSCLNELGFCEQYSESCLQHVCLLQAMTGSCIERVRLL